MDVEATVNASPSASKLGIKGKNESKMVEGESEIDTSNQKEQVESNEPPPKTQNMCNTDCSAWHIPRIQPKQGFHRIGKYGIGAWRMGNVPSDVILDKI